MTMRLTEIDRIQSCLTTISERDPTRSASRLKRKVPDLSASYIVADRAKRTIHIDTFESEYGLDSACQVRVYVARD